jgi:hypothetical protein
MKGIEYRDTDAFIDEIPAAYKDIDRVMADAADLVEVRHTLRQIVNVKATDRAPGATARDREGLSALGAGKPSRSRPSRTLDACAGASRPCASPMSRT